MSKKKTNRSEIMNDGPEFAGVVQDDPVSTRDARPHIHVVGWTIRAELPEYREHVRSLHAGESDSIITTYDIRDGSAGIVQTSNAVLDDCPPCDIVVKVDDDAILPPGWRETLVTAFERMPNAGILGFDVEDTEAGRAHTGGRMPLFEVAGFMARHPVGNIGGICMAWRYELLPAVHPVPLLHGTYHYYEDGWRCYQVEKLRRSRLYIVGREPLRVITYPTDEKYEATKRANTEANQAALHTIWK